MWIRTRMEGVRWGDSVEGEEVLRESEERRQLAEYVKKRKQIF